MPANGWWHEWTYNYDVKVDNNEVHLDIAEREAKILVYRGDNWQPSVPEPEPEPQPQPAVESSPADQSSSASQEQQQQQPAVEASPADQSNSASQEQQQQQQPDPSTNQNPPPAQSETPSQ